MKRLYRLMLLSAGSRQHQFKVALRQSLAASIAQALAYAVLLGLLYELCQPVVDAPAAWTWFAAFVALYAVEAVLRVKELGFQYRDWAVVLADVRLAIGERLRQMPLRDLERRASGDLAALVGGAVTYASMGASQVALLFLQVLTVPTVLIVVIVAIDWRIGLVLLLTLPFAIPFVRRVQQRSAAGFGDTNEADAQAASRIIEYVQGLPVLRAAGQAGTGSTRLDHALRRQTDVMTRAQKSASMPSIAASTAIQIGVVAAAAVGAALVLDARMTPALLLVVVVAAVKLTEPLVIASSMIAVLELAGAALDRVGEILHSSPLPVGDPSARLHRHDIAFDGVCFGYGTADQADPVGDPEQAGPTALRDASFVVPERSLTALVGPSGSGKTTITRLITRYADPDAGTIRIGGIDLPQLDPAEIYRHVAVVFQDVYLFDDTIRANIAMARPDASDAEVEAAARAANVHEFVSRLPQGYDTRVGEIGGALSGGERQRVSIARAILKDAPIVLLDEPTAALDSESEVAVQQAIDALVQHKTVLVIAHRLSTVVGADQILVLEDGRITERGNHRELLDRHGRYAAMWSAQTRARRWQVPAASAVHPA